MPEGPEIRLSAAFINSVAAKHVFGGRVVKGEKAVKLLDVPFEAESYTLVAESRGKELKVHLKPLGKAAERAETVKHLLFRFGMSGCFKFTPNTVEQIPKHAHLRFFTKDEGDVLCFVDYRRFGRWHINEDWGSDRGPDPVTQHPEFRQNIMDHLKDSAFNKPICEVMLNQKFFNGIGNYLRAEILHRAGVAPFENARAALERCGTAAPSIGKPDDLLELCKTIPEEVLALEGGKGYNWEPADGAEDEYRAFSEWLKCYSKPGMKNLVDSHGRTIWFSGTPGPMKPAKAKSRRTPSDNRNPPEGDDHDYVAKAKKVKASKAKARKAPSDNRNPPEGEDPDCVVKAKKVKASKAKSRKAPSDKGNPPEGEDPDCVVKAKKVRASKAGSEPPDPKEGRQPRARSKPRAAEDEKAENGDFKRAAAAETSALNLRRSGRRRFNA